MAAKQSAEVAAGWFRVAGGLSKKLYMPVAVVILITGLVLVLQDDGFSFGSSFVIIGFGMILVGALLGVFVFDPGSEQAAQAIEAGDEARIKAAKGRITTFGTVDTLLLVFTITAMVLRLGV
jgi:hypothetical protein